MMFPDLKVGDEVACGRIVRKVIAITAKSFKCNEAEGWIRRSSGRNIHGEQRYQPLTPEFRERLANFRKEHDDRTARIADHDIRLESARRTYAAEAICKLRAGIEGDAIDLFLELAAGLEHVEPDAKGGA